jgi:hypothetical protein
VAESLARLFQIYKDQRVDAETFQEFCLRHSNEELTGYLRAPAARTVVESMSNSNSAQTAIRR